MFGPGSALGTIKNSPQQYGRGTLGLLLCQELVSSQIQKWGWELLQNKVELCPGLCYRKVEVRP